LKGAKEGEKLNHRPLNCVGLLIGPRAIKNETGRVAKQLRKMGPGGVSGNEGNAERNSLKNKKCGPAKERGGDHAWYVAGREFCLAREKREKSKQTKDIKGKIRRERGGDRVVLKQKWGGCGYWRDKRIGEKKKKGQRIRPGTEEVKEKKVPTEKARNPRLG